MPATELADVEQNLEMAKTVNTMVDMRDAIRTLLDHERRQEEIIKPLIEESDLPGVILGEMGPVMPEPPVLRQFREKADFHIDTAFQWVICFVFATVEGYIDDQLQETTGAYPLVEEWCVSNEISDELRKEIHHLRIERNSVIHNNGTIDETNVDRLDDCGIEHSYEVGEEVELTPEKVNRYIDSAKEFVARDDEPNIRHRNNSTQ